jgi:hypothetical protein
MKCLHFTPNQVNFRLAKDEFHYAWNGEVKHVQVALGKGAFRT